MCSNWYAPSLRGVLGDWIYYCTLLRSKEIADRIKSSHEIREAKALEDFLQRKLKPRVSKIARYLSKRDSRFFNSLVVGIFEGVPRWAEFDLSKVTTKLEIQDLNVLKESIGLLLFAGNEKMFAIDGQHRVEGIKQAYKKHSDQMNEDQYPVIFVAHQDTPEGKMRTRRLFCDINKNAVPVSEGDKVVIDEDDLSAIVTRRIYANYPPFKRGKEIAVTERKEVLEENEIDRFTSLLAVFTVCRRLKNLYRRPRGIPETASENINALQAIISGFFDFIIKFEPSLNRYFHKKTTLQDERMNNRSLFFRPIGLEVLARLYAYFSKNGRMARLQYALENFQLDNPGGVFDGVLWNEGKINASGKAKKAAVELCLYLLHELAGREESGLTNTLREVTKKTDYSLPPKPAIPLI